MKVQGIKIEAFQSDKLVDISAHRLFRQHEKITGDEEVEISQKYGKSYQYNLVHTNQGHIYFSIFIDLEYSVRENYSYYKYYY